MAVSGTSFTAAEHRSVTREHHAHPERIADRRAERWIAPRTALRIRAARQGRARARHALLKAALVRWRIVNGICPASPKRRRAIGEIPACRGGAQRMDVDRRRRVPAPQKIVQHGEMKMKCSMTLALAAALAAPAAFAAQPAPSIAVTCDAGAARGEREAPNLHGHWDFLDGPAIRELSKVLQGEDVSRSAPPSPRTRRRS